MNDLDTEIAVLGAGPGGYTAAFYAADKGKKVVLIDDTARLGGVCLNRGCIPSKALLYATHILHDAKASASRGIAFSDPKVDIDKMRAWKESILDKLGQGVRTLAEKRNVTVLQGRGHFEDSSTLRVETSEGQRFVRFKKAILAVGSKPAMPKAFDLGNKRVMTSTEALGLEEIPAKLLVIGGGYIGLELGNVYAALGSEVTLVETLPALLAGPDPDLARYVIRAASKNFKEIRTDAKVTKMATAGKQIKVDTEFEGKKAEELYDRVLVAVGRVPNGADLGLENTRATRDEKGFIKVDAYRQTEDPNIYAIGDIAGGMLLAHKASKEARLAIDAITGEGSGEGYALIPAVIYTEPELAWCGLTETEAKAKGIEIRVTRFSWAASGRALTSDKSDGLTKLILEPETGRVLGAGIAGIGAGELISEVALAINMGATARDIAETVHPHPTLSETLMEAAEAFYGTATHLLAPKR